MPVLCGQSAVAMFRTRLLPHLICFLNVEFDQVRPISLPLIPGTNGIHATIVFIRVTFWGES